MLNGFRFPKTSRLLSPRDFKRVFSDAKRFTHNNIIICASPSDKERARIGFSFTRKKVKLSANRSKLKRICRESFRLAQYDLPAVDIIVMAKKTTNRVDSKAIWNSLEKIWAQLKNTYSGV